MDIVTISIVLGFTAGAIQFIGYVVYNWTAGDKINTGSWSVWAIAGVIDVVSYFALTEDLVVSFLPAVCAVCAIGTFGYACYKRRFSRPDKIDVAFMAVDGTISVLWAIGLTTTASAYLLYQASAVSSFVPMYRGQLSDKEWEEKLPWLIWTVAYVILAVSVFLRMKSWIDLVYPIGHAVACTIVYRIAVVKQRSSR